MKSGDKVVCIDTTFLPNYAPRDADLNDYLFPDGFVEEGAVYCVEHVFERSPGVFGLFLVGKRIFYRESEIGWYWRRFRVVGKQRETFRTKEALEVGN